jgi:hypothetical protein
MKKQGGRLENWYVVPTNRGGDNKIVWGNIFDDARFNKGAFIHTSLVESLDVENSILETLNTIYTLGKKSDRADEIWQDVLNSFKPRVQLPIPMFWIKEEYLTDVPVTFSYLESVPEGVSIEDANKSFGFSHVEHPSFESLRSRLKADELIQTERGYWNGDKVLKPFYLNDVLFEPGETFYCSTALKNVIELKLKGEEV